MRILTIAALFIAGTACAQIEMTREAITARVAGESDPVMAARIENVLLSQWVAHSKGTLENALRDPDLTSPEIAPLREKEKQLEQELLKTRLAIIEAARKLPEMQARQKEIDEAKERMNQLEKTIKKTEVK